MDPRHSRTTTGLWFSFDISRGWTSICQSRSGEPSAAFSLPFSLACVRRLPAHWQMTGLPEAGWLLLCKSSWNQDKPSRAPAARVAWKANDSRHRLAAEIPSSGRLGFFDARHLIVAVQAAYLQRKPELLEPVLPAFSCAFCNVAHSRCKENFRACPNPKGALPATLSWKPIHEQAQRPKLRRTALSLQGLLGREAANRTNNAPVNAKAAIRVGRASILKSTISELITRPQRSPETATRAIQGYCEPGSGASSRDPHLPLPLLQTRCRL